jgi:hypothetical protein
MRTMDLSKFKTSDWLTVGGAAVMLIAYFLDWSNVESSVFEISGSDLFFRGTVPWLLTVASGVIVFLLAAGVIKEGGVPWRPIIFIATALSALLVLIYIINPTYSVADDIGRGIGAWLALIGTVVAAVGAYLGFTERGGNLAKIGDSFKGAGSSGGGMAPPPPPGGMAPPPPPPPPTR